MLNGKPLNNGAFIAAFEAGEGVASSLSHETARTMRAAILTGPGQVEVKEVALPEPGAGQVRSGMKLGASSILSARESTGCPLAIESRH